MRINIQCKAREIPVLVIWPLSCRLKDYECLGYGSGLRGAFELSLSVSGEKGSEGGS